MDADRAQTKSRAPQPADEPLRCYPTRPRSSTFTVYRVSLLTRAEFLRLNRLSHDAPGSARVPVTSPLRSRRLGSRRSATMTGLLKTARPQSLRFEPGLRQQRNSLRARRRRAKSALTLHRPFWHSAIESQAIDRCVENLNRVSSSPLHSCNRLGQTREVRVFQLIVPDSVEQVRQSL